MISKGSFAISPTLRAICAVILFEEGELKSTIITKSERKIIGWRHNTLTFLPGDSLIESEGEGFKVFYFSYYQQQK